MNLFRIIGRRLRALFRGRQLDAEMADEMQAHLEMQVAEYERQGMSPDEARYAARREFGGVEQLKERCRDARPGHWFETIWRDAQYGCRMLRRQPVFTGIAVLTLGFGIGVNTTVFSVLQDLLGRPARRDERQHLVAVHLAKRGSDQGYRSFSYAEFEAVRACGAFTHAAACVTSNVRIGKTDPRPRLAGFVSEDYFSLLGVTPWRGWFFTAEETRPTADAPVVVASYAFWERMGRPPNFIGSPLEIDGQTCQVAGIAPRGFGGHHWSIGPDVWLPLGMLITVGSGRTDPADPRSHLFNILASLAPSLTLQSANGALGGLNQTLNAMAVSAAAERVEAIVARPARGNLDLTWPEDDARVDRYGALAVAAAISVMLVACLNVANMLLARGTTRQKEIALRLSLGASRPRLIRQLLTEGLVLALVGGLVGLALTYLVNDVVLNLTRQISSHQPFAFHLQPTIDLELVAGAFGLCVIATLVCSIGPALRATQIDLVHDLKRQSGDPATGGRWKRFLAGRNVLVMVQMAFSVALLFSAALVVRGLANVDADRGFDVSQQLLVKADFNLQATPKDEGLRLRNAMAHRIASVPGVACVAMASAVPYNFDAWWRRVVAVPSNPEAAAAPKDGEGIFTLVSDGYFAALDIPVLRGREFTALETDPTAKQPPVAILDEKIARRLFGDVDPIGRRIVFNPADAARKDANVGCEVVGLVRSPGDDPLAEARPPRIYFPFGQGYTGRIYFHVRASRPESVLPALRRAMGAFDRDRPVLFCGRFSDIVDHNLNYWSVRMAGDLFLLFAGAAVLLAALGVYGVKAYAVARRTREIGVRIALGAETRDVMRLILEQGLLQACVGVGAGVLFALLAGRVLSSMLYRVASTDPIALSIAAGAMVGCALVAATIPAWRATRIQPTEALRCE